MPSFFWAANPAGVKPSSHFNFHGVLVWCRACEVVSHNMQDKISDRWGCSSNNNNSQVHCLNLCSFIEQYQRNKRKVQALFIICIQNICFDEVWGEAASLVHPGLQGSCDDLVFFTAREPKSPSITCTPVIPPKHNLCTCNGCTYMTCTTTPMPDTASLSTAFSIACEMVSNRSSGSCVFKQISKKQVFFSGFLPLLDRDGRREIGRGEAKCPLTWATQPSNMVHRWVTHWCPPMHKFLITEHLWPGRLTPWLTSHSVQEEVCL